MVAFAGAAMLIILQNQSHVLLISYLTILGAMSLAGEFCLGEFKRRPALIMLMLLLLTILEPWYVFASYQAHIPAYECQLPKDKAKNIFLWKRPKANTLDECLPLYRSELYSNFRYAAAMRDSQGLFDFFPDTLMRYAFQLSLRIPAPVISAYSSNKVVVYDQVMDMNEEDINLFKQDMGSSLNLAFVTGLDSQLARLRFPRAESPKERIIVDENTSNIKIVKFDPNRLVLTARFDRNKFLVYNDAYSSYWRAYVNGRPVTVYRTNMAFKGVLVPAGENTIDFRYEPPGGIWIYWLLLAAMIAVVATGYYLSLKDKNRLQYGL